jgi:hypothetical protein
MKKDDVISRVMAEMGRKGGKRRLKTMTKEERREAASKAGKASVAARKAGAKAKRAT